jgi:hypothetical protein
MRNKIIIILTLAAGLSALDFLSAGCASKNNSSASAPTTKPTALAEKSGAQLWTDNCMRCHNLRGPETLSPSQWEVTVHHMRLRANLTGQEARKITEFLKAAS